MQRDFSGESGRGIPNSQREQHGKSGAHRGLWRQSCIPSALRGSRGKSRAHGEFPSAKTCDLSSGIPSAGAGVASRMHSRCAVAKAVPNEGAGAEASLRLHIGNPWLDWGPSRATFKRRERARRHSECTTGEPWHGNGANRGLLRESSIRPCDRRNYRTARCLEDTEAKAARARVRAQHLDTDAMKLLRQRSRSAVRL